MESFAIGARRRLGLVWCAIFSMYLAGCGGGTSSANSPASGSGTASSSSGTTSSSGDSGTLTVRVGGSIAGLQSSGLVLVDNGGDPTTVAAGATTFVMQSPISAGGSYSIAVKTPPAGETCQVNQATGNNATADVDSVSIACAPWTKFTESVVYSFTGGDDGAGPRSALIVGSDGNLYGTTSAGGANDDGGTVFKITTSGVLTTLHSFAKPGLSSDGSGPSFFSGVVQGADGAFYGVTSGGGATGNGTVYKVTSTGAETVLYSFANAAGDAYFPTGQLLLATDGYFYGTASGGAHGNGAVFKITPSGHEGVLYSFDATANGGFGPAPGLIQADDGNFYGTTTGGGANGTGTVFRLTPSGIESVVYAFQGVNTTDGSIPNAPLVQASNGNLYGTTPQGGVGAGDATAYEVSLGGTELLEATFNAYTGSEDDGFSPGSLIQATDGNFYGVAEAGGMGREGTVFQLTPQGVITPIYSFKNDNMDAQGPTAALVQASDGNFYGTSLEGGKYNAGAIFKITPQ